MNERKSTLPRKGNLSQKIESAGEIGERQHSGTSTAEMEVTGDGQSLAVRPGQRTPGSAAAGAGERQVTESTASAQGSDSRDVLSAALSSISWELAGCQRFTPEQEAILRQPVNPDLVEIKYDGTVYMPGAYYRKILNDCFGPGGWCLVEIERLKQILGCYYLQCVLVAEGKPIAQVIGEYMPGGMNPKATPGVAQESCRTDAITKGCKTLGVAEELWFPAWCRKWQHEYAVYARNDRTGKMEWRRKDLMVGATAIKPGYSGESEYDRPSTVDKENRQHLESIAREDDPVRQAAREYVLEPEDYEPGQEG